VADGPAVVVRRVFSAPIDDVFAAWTNPEAVGQWMSPIGTATMTMDFRVGGRFRLVMEHSGTSIEHLGEYRAIEPPELLVFTWRSDYTHGETLVTVRLRTLAPDSTELELTHEGLPEDQIESHAGGWGRILERLAAVCQ
jgi:uncharacterized protein YndB with AHSA1/START domain